MEIHQLITEMLPNIERFINNTGFPIAMLFIIAYFAQKAGKKLYAKLEPIIDSHFDLVSELKNTSIQQVGLISKQNEILSENFDKQQTILSQHTNQLEEIKTLHAKNICLMDKLGG